MPELSLIGAERVVPEVHYKAGVGEGHALPSLVPAYGRAIPATQ
jgi:hypothetical protein